MENSIRTTLADDGTITVTVSGEIDFSNAGEVELGIRDALAECSPSSIVVDVRDATFIDSTGLGALIEGYRAAVAAGIDFRVVNPSDTFRRVLMVTGLSEVFGLSETIDEPSQATGAWSRHG
ncbi:STAS domain-containing protein [Actinoplanes sp. CA-252034]|uniref:STAS domain-containing protein n=1 Tax=Actinoplanes sp. CA-252034 TaxID=3239906 RepID=UPI003D99D63F